MLAQINYILQLVLHAALYTITLIAFVFSLMGTINYKYAFLLELNDNGHSVINLSVLTAFLLGPCVFTTTTWAIYKFLLCYKRAEMHSNFYMKTIISLAHVMALVCWTLFVVFQPQIYKNGHVPVLDARYRDYDRNSLCWSNIVSDTYEVHDTNAIRTDFNCVYRHDFVKKCVGCRMEVRHDEPTVFNQNQCALIMMVMMTAVLQFWNMYVQRKEMRYKPTPVKTLYFESAPLKEQDTADEEEEQQSSFRMLEIISEPRVQFQFPESSSLDRLSSPPPIVQSSSSPNSPDSGIDYDIPQPFYSVPNKVVCKYLCRTHATLCA
ncbi:actin rearrangement inducing factor [Choristoneura fumiferana DEF multiple nucleopolyhedrovirus]|uniref:Actin rearrangement inducing factor n=1 Tax=Choristoneura fumiferana defective polyhedrosis virus TaxID=74660 RepID=Q6VTX7_NPVCD|nr:actin rearrangement inducing factor [Choristoneura fumiferana DEF multiple nucleopolyhedrovirus]AAQ91678.1 actin rearrangement inducing factor [Choristoneura fumiferana DEF multiple nucleopolyhedrovirus]